MAINFYTARIVLDILGATDYGIYNLVGTVVVVFSFLKSSLSEATQRFINYEMGRSANIIELRNVFSTCLNCYLILISIVVVIGELFWFFGNNWLNIPNDRMESANFSFHIVLLTFVVNIIHIPYNAAIIANEKMGVFAKISIIEALLKLLLIYCISYFSFDKLKLYALLMLLNASIISFIYIIYCHYKFELCHYIISFKTSLFKRIISFTGWNMLGSLSGVLSESGVGLLFNTFCGVLLNTAIGLSNQINNALIGFTTGFQTAFKPQLVKSYAAKQIDELQRLLFRSSKFSFFLFFLISIPLVFNMQFLLSIWLNEVPKYVVPFSQIILIGSLIDATSGVFYSTIGATGKIKKYQISISFVFLLHFFTTLILLYLGANYIWVFFSRLLTRGLINFIIGLYFIKKQVRISILGYFKNTIKPIILVAILPLIGILLLNKFLGNSQLLYVIINSMVFELLAIYSIYKWGLTLNERKGIFNIIKTKISN